MKRRQRSNTNTAKGSCFTVYNLKGIVGDDNSFRGPPCIYPCTPRFKSPPWCAPCVCVCVSAVCLPCIQPNLLISTETWHGHLCIFSPHSQLQTDAPTQFPPRQPHLLGCCVLLAGFVLWGPRGGCHPTNEFLLTSQLSIKEPVWQQPSQRPQQLFVLGRLVLFIPGPHVEL